MPDLRRGPAAHALKYAKGVKFEQGIFSLALT